MLPSTLWTMIFCWVVSGMCLEFWKQHFCSLSRTWRKECKSSLFHGYGSDPSPLFYGVPKGLALGPVLFILYTQPLFDIIDRHSVVHHMFADDTELYKSTDSSSMSCLLTAMQSCVSDVKDWSLVNKLQLKSLLLDSSQSANLPASLQIGQACIHFC